jgi:hypothetical protein
VEAFGANVRVCTREYTIIAYGIRVATVGPKDQKKATENIDA